mgnify:CR=1 FL=1
MKRAIAIYVAGFFVLACSSGESSLDASATIDASVSSAPDASAETGSETQVIRQFDNFDLTPFEETQPCVTWTLNNEKSLYVNTVTLSNRGAFHHSNWFVVPEDMYSGPDGFFDCDDRGFDELSSAVSGAVLFAQSTQSILEAQDLPEGVVIKIPPRHRVVAGVHLLNLSSRSMTTSMRMTLDLLHPQDVRVVAAPFRLGYGDLHIPPGGQSRHTGECPMAENYEAAAGREFDMKLYYILPHYHALGDYFRLEVMGGPNDGMVIHEMVGFNAEANGRSFDPPIDLTGADGLRLTCGYNNLTTEEVGWGIGDQEMCEFLGLADTGVMVDGWVRDHNFEGIEADGVISYVSPCTTQAVPKNEAQTMPTAEEIASPLYRPASDADDPDVVPVDECLDTPLDAVATLAPTLSNIREGILSSGCNYSSCHAGGTSAANLDLTTADLHSRLVDVSSVAQPDMVLVKPGSPDESWLYQLVSKCVPSASDGSTSAHMPLNSPTLMDPGLVATIRDWISAGAPE